MVSKRDSFVPVVCPLELVGDDLERYLEVRMLRLVVHPSGARAVSWKSGKEIRPGRWNTRPAVYPPWTETLAGESRVSLKIEQ